MLIPRGEFALTINDSKAHSLEVQHYSSHARLLGARLDSSRGDFTLQIRAFRISLPRYNAACLSLTPRLSGVWAVVSASEPLQRFTRHSKPLKRLWSRFACHTHLAEARCYNESRPPTPKKSVVRPRLFAARVRRRSEHQQSHD